MSRLLVSARVRVPCSTSNMGSGYDAIGLALERYLEVSFDPNDGGELAVQREGSLASLPPNEGHDLVATTFVGELRREGVEPTGVLRLTSSIPVARGLGSSAAAVLAGFDLARAALGLPRADQDAFDLALRHEGHGDNAAPCLYGGLRAVARTADGTVVIRLNLAESVGFAYAAPAARLSTESARSVLPKTVPHRVAAASLGRFAALIRGLADGRVDLIQVGVKDELHVPYRLPLIPSAAGAMSAAMDAGAWAVTVSGAGSGLMAMCEPARAAEIAEAMRLVFDAGVGDPECVGFAVRPDYQGLQRLPR
ncbi:MAG: homoserine kinase [Gemmatimonadetes bacterium]|nr:homoserine kinase [Gemmatimonadota bacterium]